MTNFMIPLSLEVKDLEKFDKGQKINSEWFFGGFRGKIPLVKRVLNFEKKYKNLT